PRNCRWPGLRGFGWPNWRKKSSIGLLSSPRAVMVCFESARMKTTDGRTVWATLAKASLQAAMVLLAATDVGAGAVAGAGAVTATGSAVGDGWGRSMAHATRAGPRMMPRAAPNWACRFQMLILSSFVCRGSEVRDQGPGASIP